MKNLVNNKALSVIILIGFSIFVLLSDDVYSMANCCFYVYITLTLLSIISSKSINFDAIWLLGFVLIILSEMMFMPNKSDVISASKYIILGNNVIIAGYQMSSPKVSFRIKEYKITNNIWFFTLIFFLTVVYIITIYPQAILTYSIGRYSAQQQVQHGYFAGMILDFGYILPSLWAYYYRGKRAGIIASFLFSLPIFILIAMCGTRFPLLFAILGYVLSSKLIHIFNIERRDIIGEKQIPFIL